MELANKKNNSENDNKSDEENETKYEDPDVEADGSGNPEDSEDEVGQDEIINTGPKGDLNFKIEVFKEKGLIKEWKK